MDCVHIVCERTYYRNEYSQPILGLISTFFGSIASKHEVDIPATSVCNSLCKPSISDDEMLSTSIISAKCPPSSCE